MTTLAVKEAPSGAELLEFLSCFAQERNPASPFPVAGQPESLEGDASVPGAEPDGADHSFGWPPGTLALFQRTGVDIVYANRVRQLTGCTDPARIVRASRKRMPALWA